MLHGVLNMPPELWNNDSPIDVMQRHSRYVQASKYIDELEADLTAAREELVETRKDFMCLAELLDGHDATECRMNLVRLKEQRDRLAEALNKLTQYDLGDIPIGIVRECNEALQSAQSPLVRGCSHDPRTLAGMPIGQYHCPECGEMVIAGLAHDPEPPTKQNG